MRMHPNDRKKHILESALAIAERDGFTNVTRNKIAEHANISPTLIHKYYGSMETLRNSIMVIAIHRAILPVIAQGIAVKNEYALNIPDALKQHALVSLTQSD